MDHLRSVIPVAPVVLAFVVTTETQYASLLGLSWFEWLSSLCLSVMASCFCEPPIGPAKNCKCHRSGDLPIPKRLRWVAFGWATNCQPPLPRAIQCADAAAHESSAFGRQRGRPLPELPVATDVAGWLSQHQNHRSALSGAKVEVDQRLQRRSCQPTREGRACAGATRSASRWSAQACIICRRSGRCLARL